MNLALAAAPAIRLPAGLDPSPAEGRSWLQDELSKAEYQEPGGWLERFFRWLISLFQPPSGTLDGFSVPPGLTIAIAVLVIALLVFVVTRIRSDRSVVSDTTHVLGELDQSTADYQALAEAAMRAEAWGEAVLHYTRALARDAVDRDLLRDAPSLTAHEIGARLAGVFPDLGIALGQGMDCFDRVRYSGYAATAADARAAADLADRSRRARPALSPSTVAVPS